MACDITNGIKSLVLCLILGLFSLNLSWVSGFYDDEKIWNCKIRWEEWFQSIACQDASLISSLRDAQGVTRKEGFASNFVKWWEKNSLRTST